MAELSNSYPEPRPSAAPMIGLDAAYSWLVADISDEEAAAEEKENLDKAKNGLGLSEPDPAWPKPPDLVAALLSIAPLQRMKEQAAFHKLEAAFSNDKLQPLLQNWVGAFICVTVGRWQESAYHYEIIVGGLWRDDSVKEHDGLPVFLDRNAFHAWRQATKPAGELPSTAPEATSSAEAANVVEATGVAVTRPAKRSRNKSEHPRASFQAVRVSKVLRKRYPDGYPSEEEVSTPDLLKHFADDYDEMLKKGKLSKTRRGMPSDSTVLREVGRKKD